MKSKSIELGEYPVDTWVVCGIREEFDPTEITSVRIGNSIHLERKTDGHRRAFDTLYLPFLSEHRGMDVAIQFLLNPRCSDFLNFLFGIAGSVGLAGFFIWLGTLFEKAGIAWTGTFIQVSLIVVLIKACGGLRGIWTAIKEMPTLWTPSLPAAACLLDDDQAATAESAGTDSNSKPLS